MSEGHLLREQGPAYLRIAVERRPGGRWHVDVVVIEKAGMQGALGEGETFDDAWTDQCDPRLREPMTEAEKRAAIKRGIAIAKGDPLPTTRPRPQLCIVGTGGGDNG